MSQKKILIVDDEKNILSTLKSALELEGFECDVAGSAEIGLEKLDKSKPDIILLDLFLPGMNGLEMLKKVKEHNPYIPVLMMSGHGSIKDALESVKLGAHDFIEKPISAEKALITINNVLHLANLDEGNKILRSEIDERYRIIGESQTIKDLLSKVDAAAPSKGRILITGESGTGKELIARRLHSKSDRANKPFVKVNCAAIPGELIESELFGHKKGSFTGAIAERQGKFKQADGGTLFLDEIGDMKLEMQAKLLRVLQEGEFESIGSEKTIKVDVRVISATNKDLKEEIKNGDFREDLYYRLNVVPLYVPPLRERKEDIPLLVEHFIRLACEENNRPLISVTKDAMRLMVKQPWPGNIRQLKNLCEKLVILTSEDEVTPESLDLVEESGETNLESNLVREGSSLKEMSSEAEKKIILHYLKENNWNMTATARALQLERSHLYKKCKSLGIET